MPDARSIPPAPDEFEVSIIGPGKGECVIIHLGDNEWCIVDSCIPRGESEPVALEYLNSFKNNAVAGIKLVIATHWHDDHIRGLSSILKNSPHAHFYCSMALDHENFFQLTATAAMGIQGNSGVDEFGAILGIIDKTAATKQAKRLASPKYAIANRILLDLPKNGRSFPVSIRALSPSDGSVKLALKDIASLIPVPGQAQRRVTPRSPNHASIVLWIQAGPATTLLGADLEHTPNAGEGWIAVVDCHKGGANKIPAELFKVAHHGSKNGEYSDIWAHMLRMNPIAVVTPFNGGSTPLPTKADLDRLKTRTNRLYCTSQGPGKAPARDSLVERTMRMQLSSRRVFGGQSGQVRVRWRIGSTPLQPIIEKFHGAYSV